MEKKKKVSFQKVLMISVIAMALIVLIALLGRMAGFGTDLLFIGLLVWLKCFHKKMEPIVILKVWTSGAVGIGIVLGELLAAQAFGHGIGTATLLVLLFVQIVLDVGHVNDWIVGPATPFFVAGAILLAHGGNSIAQILYDYAAGFALAGLPFILIAAVMKNRKIR